MWYGDGDGEPIAALREGARLDPAVEETRTLGQPREPMPANGPEAAGAAGAVPRENRRGGAAAARLAGAVQSAAAAVAARSPLATPA